MKDLATRISRVRPGLKPLVDFTVLDNGQGPFLAEWNSALPVPTEAELLAVDLTQPTAQEASLAAAIQILKTDVPDSWRTSTNAHQRIAWATKRLFVEAKREIQEGGA